MFKRMSSFHARFNNRYPNLSCPIPIPIIATTSLSNSHPSHFLGLSTILSNPHSAKNTSILQRPHLRTLCTHCISGDIFSFLHDTTMLALESLHLHLHARFTGNLNVGPMVQRSLAHTLLQLLDLNITESIFKSPKSFVVF